MKRIGVILTVLILLFVVIPAGVSYADPGFDRVIGEGETVEEDIVLFGGTLLIEKGATVDGSVSVFGGEVTIAGQVDGDVAVFGGELTVSGSINGDMVVLGGNLQADSTASVDGDCVLVGGTVSGDGKDSIGCTAFGDFPKIALPAIIGSRGAGRLPLPDVPEFREVHRGPGFFGTMASVFGRSLFLGLIALILAAVVPANLNQISDTMKRKPAATGAVGLLTLIAGISLIVMVSVISAILIIVCIGLLGIPLVIVMCLALLVALIMGWVAAGLILGRKMAKWLKLSNWSAPLVAAMGTVTLTLAAGILSAAPFWLGGWVWWLLAFGIGCAGLGAAALTRFGTRPYPVAVAGYGDKIDVVLDTLPSDDEFETTEKPPVE